VLSWKPYGIWRKLKQGRDLERERDRNTAYFFAVANQRHRKKAISWLENNGEILEDNASMLEHAREFYQTIFGKEPRRNFKLDPEFWEDDERVRNEENELLEALFSEEEIRKAIFDSYAEGVPSPDGFSFLFYQKFWSLIKHDFMALVRGFE
jgi:hypothetical protein